MGSNVCLLLKGPSFPTQYGYHSSIPIAKCMANLEASLRTAPTTWLTPQFSITERTPELAAAAGIRIGIQP